MACDPRTRDSTWNMIAPGLWLDPDGCGHVFPDEICAALDITYDEETYHLIVEEVREGMASRGIPVSVVQHERKEDS